jgi:AraC-like DNA-binding protein
MRLYERNPNWSDDEKQFLVDNYENMTDRDMAEEITKRYGVTRTTNAVSRMMSTLKLKRRWHQWTDRQIAYVIRNLGNKTTAEIADDLGMKRGVIDYMLKTIRDSSVTKTVWDDDMIQYLRDMFGKYSYKDIADELGVSVSSVTSQAYRLGLCGKSKEG